LPTKASTGLSRFRSKNRYDSFTYPQTGFKLNGRLWLSKIGNIKIKLHRPIKGEIKTLTIKRENDRWYACFSVVVEPMPLPANDKAVGVDVGLSSFAVLSDGTEIENPHLLKKRLKQLRRAQRRDARRKSFRSVGRKRFESLRRFTARCSTNAMIFSTSCLVKSPITTV
jgi:putative transposase